MFPTKIHSDDPQMFHAACDAQFPGQAVFFLKYCADPFAPRRMHFSEAKLKLETPSRDSAIGVGVAPTPAVGSRHPHFRKTASHPSNNVVFEDHDRYTESGHGSYEHI